MLREDALKLLKENVQSEQLLRHSFCVEAAMRAYAEKFNEDIEYYGLVGLLHDIDFEKYPEEHPAHAPELLDGYGFSDDFISTILSHGINSDIARDDNIKKTLHAVDSMSSFILAVAMMRPNKLEGLTQKSVKKKMKDKRFSAKVDRDELISSMELLGVTMEEHVNTIVKGLKSADLL